VTIENAVKQAVVLDKVLQAQIGAFILEAPHKVVSSIRAYLIRRAGEIAADNNPWVSLEFTKASKGVWLITMGPTIDQGETPDHFHFDSGARLSFGLTLKEDGNRSRLVSFRYQYNLPDTKSPRFLRFDLNPATHENPLTEPLCHLHPGLEDVRLPWSLHHPLEILDRIFFVVDRNL
jgi:hypothetical protein